MLDEDAANTFGNIESVPWHVTPSGIVARSAVLARSAALVNSSVPVLPIAHGKFDSLLETYDKELQCKKIHRASEATFHFLRSPTPTTTTMTMPTTDHGEIAGIFIQTWYGGSALAIRYVLDCIPCVLVHA